MSDRIKHLSIVSSIILVLALFLKRNYDLKLTERLMHVHDGLIRAEQKIQLQHRTKVGVGFGGCHDAFLPALEAWKGLQLTPSNELVHHNLINNKTELEQLFNYFFYHGAAVERYVKNPEFFKEIVSFAKSYADTRWHVGGNAPVMAQRLAMEGSDVLLGARKSPNVLFGDNVKGIGDQDEDDVHVILEYDKNEVWGNITTPRANRLIVHSDQYNPMLNMIEEFEVELKKFQPRLFVLGGLQMMDNFPFEEGVRSSRFLVLQNFLSAMPTSTLIHFEMASFAEEDLVHELIDKVLPYADSLGMNEQELPNILAVLNKKPVQLVADSNPRVVTALDDIRELFRAVGNLNGSRRLTRVHVHTLAYQAVVTVKGSPWKNTMSAAAKSALVANRHVCGNSTINLEKARIILDESFRSSRIEGSERIFLKDERPVSCWEENDMLFCVAPNLVCTHIFQTGGGGDNISAAGLSLQIVD